jgi:hypothetical protein
VTAVVVSYLQIHYEGPHLASRLITPVLFCVCGRQKAYDVNTMMNWNLVSQKKVFFGWGRVTLSEVMAHMKDTAKYTLIIDY